MYQAIRKYGVENFTFEVLQDNIADFEELDKAEVYWINYYNTFIKGYNSNLGGQLYHEVLPNEEIIQDYYKTRSARKTALNFGIDHSTVDNILNANHIPRFTFRQAAGKRIRITKGNFSMDFDSVKDCAEWFVENNISKSKNPESVRTGLKKARQNNDKGYYFDYLIENIED